jgi:hypothetical protein
MATIVLGNTAPIEARKIKSDSLEVTRIPIANSEATTTFSTPGHLGVGEALQTVSAVFKSHHSDATPAWVESDDVLFADALSKEFGCPIGRPDGWGSAEAPVSVAPVSSVTPTDLGVTITPASEQV